MEGLKVKHTKEWKFVPNHPVTICSGELKKLKGDNAELLEALKSLVNDMKYYGIPPERQEIYLKLIHKAEGRA